MGDCAERGGAVSHQCSLCSVVLAPAKPPVSDRARPDRPVPPAEALPNAAIAKGVVSVRVSPIRPPLQRGRRHRGSPTIPAIAPVRENPVREQPGTCRQPPTDHALRRTNSRRRSPSPPRRNQSCRSTPTSHRSPPMPQGTTPQHHHSRRSGPARWADSPDWPSATAAAQSCYGWPHSWWPLACRPHSPERSTPTTAPPGPIRPPRRTSSQPGSPPPRTTPSPWSRTPPSRSPHPMYRPGSTRPSTRPAPSRMSPASAIPTRTRAPSPRTGEPSWPPCGSM